MKIFLLTFFIVLSFCSFGQAAKSSLSFGESSEKIVRFFPNPAVSVINFEFNNVADKGYSLRVFNFVGKKVLDVPSVSQKTSVSLNDFFRGVYIFQLLDKTGRIIESGKFQVSK